jgi:hypothetical protein
LDEFSSRSAFEAVLQRENHAAAAAWDFRATPIPELAGHDEAAVVATHSVKDGFGESVSAMPGKDAYASVKNCLPISEFVLRT